MNCPVCGSELPSAVKYCPVCGTDVESVQLRAQQMAARTAPTQQMPSQRPAEYYQQQGGYQQAGAYQQAQAPRPQQQGRAVPMNSSMPPQSAGRSIDTSAMNSTPKWPFVLIALLVVLIVAVLLLIFRPWDVPAGQNGDTQGTGAQSGQVVDGQGTGAQDGAAQQAGTGIQQGGTGQVSDTTVPTDATQAANLAVFQNLSNYYGQLAGLDAQISSAAADFNSYFLSDDAGLRASYAASASQLLNTIDTNLAAVQALSVTADSPYYATWQNIVTLYQCLSNRARVIAEAWSLSANAADPNAVYDQIVAVLAADNVNGVNQYKTQYEELYPLSQPVQA